MLLTCWCKRTRVIEVPSRESSSVWKIIRIQMPKYPLSLHAWLNLPTYLSPFHLSVRILFVVHPWPVTSYLYICALCMLEVVLLCWCRTRFESNPRWATKNNKVSVTSAVSVHPPQFGRQLILHSGSSWGHRSVWRSVSVWKDDGWWHRRQVPLHEVSGRHGHRFKAHPEGFEMEVIWLARTRAHALQFERQVARAGRFLWSLGAQSQDLFGQILFSRWTHPLELAGQPARGTTPETGSLFPQLQAVDGEDTFTMWHGQRRRKWALFFMLFDAVGWRGNLERTVKLWVVHSEKSLL